MHPGARDAPMLYWIGPSALSNRVEMRIEEVAKANIGDYGTFELFVAPHL